MRRWFRYKTDNDEDKALDWPEKFRAISMDVLLLKDHYGDKETFEREIEEIEWMNYD